MIQPKSTDPDLHEDTTCATALARKALLAFVLTFIASRTVVFLIMSDRIPNLYFFLKGTHVHHLNYGIFLLAGVGAYLLFRAPRGNAANRAAFVYGIAMGLTFDEFGMWLHLGGAYWQRASVDAAIVVAALLSLIAFAPSWKALESRHRGHPLPSSLPFSFSVLCYSTPIRRSAIWSDRDSGSWSWNRRRNPRLLKLATSDQSG